MYLDKNIALIKKYNLELAEILEKSSNNDNDIEILDTRDGLKTLKIKGKLIHSQYKPREETAKIFEKIELKGKNILIINGTGMGYYIYETLSKCDEDAVILVLEPNLAALKIFLENTNLEEIDKIEKVRFVYTGQKFYYSAILDNIFKLGIAPEYEIINNKVLNSIYTEEFDEMFEIFKEAVSNLLVLTATIFDFAKMWHKNSYRNLRHFVQSIGVQELFDKFKNIPVIVVAAGPSLEKNIRYLHWAKGKAVIVAVGTSMRRLFNEGITPDFVLSIDGGYPNWEHFSRAEYSHVPLIYEPMLYPSITDYHHGKKIVFVSNSIVGAWAEHVLGKKGFLKTGGTVAISAYDFANKTGGNPVILMGQDLAYSGGKTHAAGTVSGNDSISKNMEDMHQMEVEDIYGGQVLTDRKMFTFKKYFERFIADDLKRRNSESERAKEGYSEYKVLDCTEGGAKIEGTEIVTFKEAYFKYIEKSTINVDEILRDIEKEMDIEGDREKLRQFKKDMLEKLTRVENISKEGIKILKQAMNKGDYSRIGELDALDERINKEEEVSNLIKNITQPIISEIIKKTKNDNSDDREVLALNLKLYQGIKDNVEFNIQCMEEIK